MEPHVLFQPLPVQGHVKPMLALAELISRAGLGVTFVNSHHIQALLDSSTGDGHPKFLFVTLYDGLLPDVPRIVELMFSTREVMKPAFRQLLDDIVSGGDNMDEVITCIPGLEGILKRRDFPGPGKVAQTNSPPDSSHFSLTDTATTLRASALILNVVEELEAPAVAKLATVFPRVYSLGPLHALLGSPSSVGFRGKEDRSCLAWLDTKPARSSVLFVSFGSLLGLSSDQTLELWYGLANSGKPFLWVNKGKLESCGWRERGWIVDWAPQVEVLAHPSVGGFMTHSGWNSTVESVSAGVPMICWPGMGDQFVNRRLVTDLWGVGLDMEDMKCTRAEVEKMVRELMEEKREELMVSMEEVSRKASESVKRKVDLLLGN